MQISISDVNGVGFGDDSYTADFDNSNNRQYWCTSGNPSLRWMTVMSFYYITDFFFLKKVFLENLFLKTIYVF